MTIAQINNGDGGLTARTKLNEAIAIANAAIITSGSGTVQNVVRQTSTAEVHADANSSILLGGTDTSPLLLGIEAHNEYFTGDGVTTDFAATAPFVVTDRSPRITTTVSYIRPTDGVFVGNAAHTVTGLGTTTVTVSLGAPPPDGALVEVLLYGTADDASAVVSLQHVAGYDNLVSPIMSVALGAHGYLPAGDGHNAVLGGSYGRIYGRYSTILGGQGNIIGRRDSASFGCLAMGQGNQADGTLAIALGMGLDVQGDGSAAIGRESTVASPDTFLTGRKGRSYAPGERVHASGRATYEMGDAQIREASLMREVVGDTTTSLISASGASTLPFPAGGVATLEVSVAGKMDDTNTAAYRGSFLLDSDSGGVTRVNGSQSDVAIPLVYSRTASGWAVFIRAISSGIRVRVQNGAGETVKWVASVKITETLSP